MTELKSTIPDDPTGLLRTRYKYIHSKNSVYILAYFMKHYDNLNDPHSWEEQYHEDVVSK
jgi:hypothetical protein